MATESPLRLTERSGSGNWPVDKGIAAFASSTGNLVAEDLGLLLKGQRYHGSRNITGPSRSGSAPPSMEGSRAAFNIFRGQGTSGLDANLENVGNAFESCESEEQLRAHPAYLAYYCANVNLNPRLPPPLISRENRHLIGHIGGSGENWRVPSFDDSSRLSLFLARPALATHKEESEDDKSPRMETVDWTEKNAESVSGESTSSLPASHRSLMNLMQEDLPRTPSLYNNQSHLGGDSAIGQSAGSDACVSVVHDSPTNMTSPRTKTSSIGVQDHTPISGVQLMLDDNLPTIPFQCSTSSGRTVNLHRGLRAESSINGINMNNEVFLDTEVSLSPCVENEMKSLRLADTDKRNQHLRQQAQEVVLQTPGASSLAQLGPSQGMHLPHNANHLSHGLPKLSTVDVQPALQPTGITPPLFATATTYGNTYYPNFQISNLLPQQFSMGGYAVNTSLMPTLIPGYPPQNAMPIHFDSSLNTNFNIRAPGVSAAGTMSYGADFQHLYKSYGQLGIAIRPPFPDHSFMPYFQHPTLDAYVGADQYDVPSRLNAIGVPPGNYDPQKGPFPTAYLPSQMPQVLRSGSINSPIGRKVADVNPNYYGRNPNIGDLIQYPTSPLGSPSYQGFSVTGAGFSGKRNENMRVQLSPGRTIGSFSGWQGPRGREKAEEPKPCSFLEELKSNKGRRYELSDITGRVVEFSADQHGSRFIQQKLETCSAEDKASVFKEVLPQASSLMTDVFGNYVIQKFFEHGNPDQRKELADKLSGHILSLSLQMYGCRVIQKALEVIELNQKTQLVQELDGHVMRCVRDQNGNHVIQKCIECIPTEKIDFIISALHGQVATLSTHPYGCRVIQRVLEHCTDEMQSQCIVDEILQSVCLLAEDQYGNYVIQHVLERGMAQKRTQLISKLAGHVVQMSQHKYASNVIEKCLEYGNIAERKLLIEEILGQTEGNDNLLVMMKDQFANYVVQKILDTCVNEQRDLLLSRIKVHLLALKKYTYGKHIAARVEQLCGEESQVSDS
ncbi:pumilio homolog 5-like [Typha latifolia]|uniref:pumilio homolog 5-like n=1 Tax=Typha latifolia TaxID=4733 RepID=UPI003C2B9A99